MKVKLGKLTFTLKFKEVPPDCLGEIRIGDMQIDVSHKLRGRRRLEVVIHEMLHGLFPRMWEATVDRAANDLANALWKLGVRFK